MSLLTAPIFKKSNFVFLKNVLYETSKAFNTKFGSQWKDWESSCQVKQVLSLFWKLVTLLLS